MMLELLKEHYLLVSAIGYITASLTCFFYPNLIHKPRVHKSHRLNESIRDKGSVMIVAHRGGSRIGFQNTLETFTKCLSLCKADMLQMDVCYTRDKQLIVHHDVSLLRTCGKDQRVDEFDFLELPDFSQKVTVDFSRGLLQECNGEKMPLLSTIFEKFPHMLMNIELKTPSLEAVEEFNRLVRMHRMEDKVIWGIRGKLHSTLKTVNPNMLTFFDEKQVLRVLGLFITGLLPFFPISDDSLQIPIWTEDYYLWKLEGSQNKMMVHTWFTLIKFLNFMYTPIIGHLRKRGILSIGWVCNQEEEYERALKMGVCGIMTDRPNHLEEYLRKKVV